MTMEELDLYFCEPADVGKYLCRRQTVASLSQQYDASTWGTADDQKS